jgi:protein gp37
MANRLCSNPSLPLKEREALAGEGPVVLRERELSAPLRAKKPAVIGVQFMGDLFHEDVPDEFRDDAYAVMHGCDRHTYLILTKRADNLLRYSQTHFLPGYQGRDHIWHGVTICNQPEADAKIPELLKVPGKKFISYEPALRPVDFRPFLGFWQWSKSENFQTWVPHDPSPIDLIICGGESGPGARPTHPDWVRSVRDQCAAAGTAFYFKQWGEWAPFENHPDLAGKVLYGDPRTGYWQNNHPGHYSFQHRGVSSHGQHMLRVGTKRAGRLLDGKEHNELAWREVPR